MKGVRGGGILRSSRSSSTEARSGAQCTQQPSLAQVCKMQKLHPASSRSASQPGAQHIAKVSVIGGGFCDGGKIIENLLAENHLHVQARLCVCLCIRQCQVRTIPIFLDRSEGTLHRGIIVVRHPCWALLRESIAKMVTSVRVAIAVNDDW